MYSHWDFIIREQNIEKVHYLICQIAFPCSHVTQPLLFKTKEQRSDKASLHVYISLCLYLCLFPCLYQSYIKHCVGRWSGSERYSLDSDGLFSATSQNRLSKLSADRDSALGADINDNRYDIGTCESHHYKRGIFLDIFVTIFSIEFLTIFKGAG